MKSQIHRTIDPQHGQIVWKWGSREIILRTIFLVPELMQSMNFTGWGDDDYYGLYDQLIQALDPAYDMPPNLEMGANNNEWSPGFLAKKAKNQVKLKQASTELATDVNGNATSGDDISEADRSYMMRYMQLKYSILFLQQYRYLGKYCFYGCWCLPNGVGDIGTVSTNPRIDNEIRIIRTVGHRKRFWTGATRR